MDDDHGCKVNQLSDMRGEQDADMTAMAAHPSISTLESAVAAAPDAGARIYALQTLADALTEVDPQRALDTANTVARMAVGLENPTMQARATTTRARSFLRLGHFDEALDLAHEALGVLDETGDKAGSAKALLTLSEIHEELGDLRRSLDAFKAFHGLEMSVREGTREALAARADAEAEDVNGMRGMDWFIARATALYDRASAGSGRMTVAMIGVDGAQMVLDAHGRTVLDQVLARVGEILLHSCRTGDIVARCDATSFALAFPNGDAWTATAACDRFRRMIETCNWSDLDEGLAVTVSAGVAAGTQTGTLDDLVKIAETGLGAALSTGRNHVQAPPRS